MTKPQSILRLGAIAALVLFIASASHATLLNPSFEFPEIGGGEPTPDDWSFFGAFDTSGVVEDAGVARTGDQFLQFFANGDPGVDVGRQGYFQQVQLALDAGQTVSVDAFLRDSAGLPMQAGTVAILGIEFLRANNSEINRSELIITPDMLTASGWTKFSVYGSPDGEAAAKINVVVAQEKVANSLASSGIFFVEDVNIIPEPTTLLLIASGAGVLVWRRRRTLRQ